MPKIHTYLPTKILLLTAVFTIAVTFQTCTPVITSWTSPVYTPHKFNKIVVFGMFKRLDDRIAFEESVVDALMKQGYPAAHGMTLIPPGYDLHSKEQMNRIIKSENFQMVVMASTIDESVQLKYHSNYNGPYAYGGYSPGYNMYNYYNYRYGYDINYGGYGYGWQNPGYYTEETTMLVDCQIYDMTQLKNDEPALIWSGQSELNKSSGMRTLATRYANYLLKDLKKNEILN